MTDSRLPDDEPLDPTADTGRFQAFVEGDDDLDRPPAAGVSFRLATLVGGLLVGAALIWLLFLL